MKGFIVAFLDEVMKLTEGLEAIGDVNEYVEKLKQEHQEEISTYETKLGKVNDDLAERDQRIVKLKLTNYDLITSKGANSDPEPNGEPEPEPVTGVDSLFKTKE